MAKTTQAERAAAFLQLHHGDRPLLIPNPWDQGSAKVLAGLGFRALATTSGGFAATLGRLDGHVTRDEALGHAALIASATELPVSADLENGFGVEPADVAVTVEGAIGAGLFGCSIEDFTRDPEAPIYELALATDRIAAAVEVAHRGPVHLVLTARAENYIHGRPDLDDTIARLQAYQDAGADVLFAPGLTTPADIRRVVECLERPLNVVTRAGLPSVAELAALGVRRISVGQAFAYGGYGATVEAAREFLEEGTYGFMERAGLASRPGNQPSRPDAGVVHEQVSLARIPQQIAGEVGAFEPRVSDQGSSLSSTISVGPTALCREQSGARMSRRRSSRWSWPPSRTLPSSRLRCRSPGPVSRCRPGPYWCR